MGVMMVARSQLVSCLLAAALLLAPASPTVAAAREFCREFRDSTSTTIGTSPYSSVWLFTESYVSGSAVWHSFLWTDFPDELSPYPQTGVQFQTSGSTIYIYVFMRKASSTSWGSVVISAFWMQPC